MYTFFCRFLAVLFSHAILFTLVAQTPEKSLADMNWQEMTEKWEALSIAGQNFEALTYARAALEKARRDSSEAGFDYGNSLDYLGYSLHHTGQHSEAERCFLAAVAHARLYLGENHEDYITRLSNLAMLHLDMCELAKAVSELEVVVNLATKNLPDDNPFFAIMVNNLGLAYERSGNLEKALEYYLQALLLTEKNLGKGNARYGIRLVNIAAIYRLTGKVEQALEFNLQAQSVFENSVGKKHPLYALGLNGLISSYVQMSRYQEALAASDELLAIVDHSSLKESTEFYDFTCNIANLYFASGQYQRCADFSKTMLNKFQQTFPTLYSDQSYMARVAMHALEKMGKPQEAVEFALLHNRFSLDELRENFSEFTESEQLQLYQTYRRLSDIPSLLFAVRHPEFPEMAAAAYNYQMTIKGLSLANRRQLFQSLREHPDAQLSEQFGAWKRLQNEISRQYALTPAKRQANLDSLLTVSNTLERKLAIASETFRLTSQNARWQDVQAALAPGEAAIEFAQLKNPKTDSTLYMAWVLRAGDTYPQQVFLFEEKELGQIAATRRLYTPEPPATGKNLHQLLWKPLEPMLKGVSTIYYAPAGILHQINLGAVPVSASAVLDDRFHLHRLVSTRQIISLKNAPAAPALNAALVFGGIRYESDSLALASTNTILDNPVPDALTSRNRGATFGSEWSFLTGSLQEAVSVRQRLETAGAKVSFADGFHASEGYFKKSVQSAPAPAVLHLATHGFFVTAADSSAHSGFATAENPMARAGLALSGANRVWGGEQPFGGQEDGILTALEISRMDLSGTELAVLSACGTGQGKIEAGEGVLGLQRAFKMAGVHYVIMTLWNVQDEDAQQFMDFFYGQWLTQKKSIPDAFRAAQQRMRAIHATPFQPMAWAGFLLLE